MKNLKEIEGIGEVYENKLKELEITSVEGLLEACTTPKDRAQLAEETGISEKLILKWANHADLFRIKGIGSEYAELLEAAGVDTVPELAQRRADNLLDKVTQINNDKKLVRKLPDQKQIEDWIQQAAALPRIMKY